jgi:Protein of unknown function (DUF1592)/Protein of unknown function (DUF1588)/Protein of unknown function (DUF1587)/Protein of unknown function (DUF1595)/Protein of unknown function (DUF1585)
MGVPATWLWIVAGLGALAGCTGTIGRTGTNGSNGNGAMGPFGPSGAPVGVAGGAGGAGGQSGAAMTAALCAGVPIDPGPVFLRRLTNAEYRQTVRDLLGNVPDEVGGFPTDAVNNGFDNNAEAISLSNLHVEKYRDAAEALAAAVFADPAKRDAVLGCSMTATRDACLQTFITTFGRRAFRRPLAPDDVAALTALGRTAAGDAEPTAPAALVLQGILQSPQFLFRVETGLADIARPGLLRLSGFEIATRLSYLLRGTTPDDMLLAAAEQGQLDTAAGVTDMATRLWGDTRARGAVRNFYGQWLEFPLLASVTRDSARYPLWNDALGASMQEETARLMDDFIWKEGAPVLDVLTARSTTIDARLAKLYGQPAVSDWTRIEFGAGDARGGLLTQPSLLTATAKNETALPIHRGKFIRAALLCESLPPPPNNVPKPPPPSPGVSDQQRLEQHRSDPSCSGCHALLEPVGFGLARYDMIGGLRTVDSSGQPVSSQGSLSGFGAPQFDGALELGQVLHDSPEVASCLVTQLFRYTHARKETDVDQCELARVETAFRAAGGTFKSLLLAFVASDGFRYRRTHDLNGGI